MTYPAPKSGIGLKTICVDLDGTLAEPTWPKPEVGEPIQSTVDAVIEASRDGWEIVVFTARPESHKTEIKLWLLRYGLADIVYDVICGKPRAAAYWDDRAVTFPEAFVDLLVEPSKPRMMSQPGVPGTHIWGPNCPQFWCKEALA